MLDIIRKLCKEQRITIGALEVKAGLATNTINRWDKTSPSISRVVAVADVLGVSLDELVGRDSPDLPPGAGDLVRLYAELNEDGRLAAVKQLQFLATQPEYIKSHLSAEMEG